jgi:hypothetical protein
MLSQHENNFVVGLFYDILCVLDGIKSTFNIVFNVCLVLNKTDNLLSLLLYSSISVWALSATLVRHH